MLQGISKTDLFSVLQLRGFFPNLSLYVCVTKVSWLCLLRYVWKSWYLPDPSTSSAILEKEHCFQERSRWKHGHFFAASESAAEISGWQRNFSPTPSFSCLGWPFGCCFIVTLMRAVFSQSLKHLTHLAFLPASLLYAHLLST